MLGTATGPYARLLDLWLVERPRGPGHVTAWLVGWEPPPRDHPDRARCLCLAAALRAGEALRTGDVPTLTAEVGRAERELPAAAPWLAFVVAAVLQAAYRMAGDPALARRTLELCAAVGDRTDLPWLAVQARALGGSVHMLQGRFHRAEDLLVSSTELGRATGRGADAETGMTLQFRGYLRYEWNRLDEARELLLRAVDAGEAAGSAGVLSGTYRMLVNVALARHDPAAAAGWLGRLEDLMFGPLSDRNREWMAAVRAGFRAATGDLRGAAEAVRQRGYRARELAEADAPHLLGRLMELTLLLDVLGALERWEETELLAARLRAVATGAERRWFAVRAGAWEAAAREALGRSDEADALAERLAESVEEEGYVRALADLGAPLLPVVERLASRVPRSGALGRVVAATRAHASWAGRRPSLTPREADVLGLLARGCSTKAIARELDISVATVKTHLHHLYRKLEVSSRTEAVARARSLALL